MHGGTGDSFQTDAVKKNPPSTPVLSVQNRHTGNRDNLHCRCGCAAECKRHKSCSFPSVAVMKRDSFFVLFCFFLHQLNKSTLCSSFLSTNCLGCVSFLSEPSLLPPRIHHVGPGLLSHVLRQTGLTAGGGGEGSAIKNGGESLRRKAETAESALPNTHPRTHSRVSPGNCWVLKVLYQDRQHM